MIGQLSAGKDFPANHDESTNSFNLIRREIHVLQGVDKGRRWLLVLPL
jgi:hypothetical protein